MTLGRVDFSETGDAPVLGGALTLRSARELANRIDRERARGADVIADYFAAQRRADASATASAANSFTKLLREFFVDHKTRKWGTRPRRWRGDAQMMGLVWLSDSDPAAVEPELVKGSLADRWRDRPVAEIDAHDVYAVVDEARRLGIPGTERRGLKARPKIAAGRSTPPSRNSSLGRCGIKKLSPTPRAALGTPGRRPRGSGY